ncbi:hypothetical protein SHKM778_79190 [Streptomyces sp. KM77-8]|uniref:Uncharacterized protein n=1 Tax=Streptomyces haneummycinicus TaxID=3074435 RepID=A0AAT9HVW9_9ACTN
MSVRTGLVCPCGSDLLADLLAELRGEVDRGVLAHARAGVVTGETMATVLWSAQAQNQSVDSFLVSALMAFVDWHLATAPSISTSSGSPISSTFCMPPLLLVEPSLTSFWMFAKNLSSVDCGLAILP